MKKITSIGYAAVAITALGCLVYRFCVNIDKGEEYYVRQCLKQTLTNTSGSHRHLQLDLDGGRRINVPISRETSDEEVEELRASFDGGIVEPIGKPFSTAKWGRHATYLLDNLYLVESSRTYGVLSARMKVLERRMNVLGSHSEAIGEEMGKLRSKLTELEGGLSNYGRDTETRLRGFETKLEEMERIERQPAPEPPRRPETRRIGGETWERAGENRHGQPIYTNQ